MKIALIIPGSGGTFYCQNCMRDVSLTNALRELGHDAFIVPMYLPRFAGVQQFDADAPVFFGAVNVFLKERVPLFRKAPNWLDKLLDSPTLLGWAAKKAGSTRASGLEEMTLSMLRHDGAHQVRELDRMIQWLHQHDPPDIIHLSNALLMGLAPGIANRLKTPIITSLQDEDTWIESMRSPYQPQVWKAMADRARNVDGFISVSQSYKDKLVSLMRIPAERVHVVPIGVSVDPDRHASWSSDPPVLGYLSRLSKSLGFHHLVDAFIDLKQREGLADLRLRAFGGHTPDDRKFIRQQVAKMKRAGVVHHAELVPEFDPEQLDSLLEGVTVLSVPANHGEAFGTYLIEAWARGIPVVQPRSGAFTELIESTGAGLLYDPSDPDQLTQNLHQLLRQPRQAQAMGSSGQDAVRQNFTLQHMARSTVRVYETVLQTRQILPEATHA